VLRRSACLAFVLVSTTSAAHAATPCATAPAAWRPHVQDAREWAQTRRGTVSFAVRTPAGLAGWHTRRTVRTASVVKAMLLVAYLNRPSVRQRTLTRDETRHLLGPMIRQSGNRAATRVRDIVGNAALVRVARRAGMRHFAVHAIWGYSRTDAADQTRFFLRLERYVPARHRATALRLLRTIVPSQRWGIARVALPGWRLYFKGGWGSGVGEIDHQVALLRGCGDARIAVAILTTSQGTHEYGKRTLQGVAARLLAGLGVPSHAG
jgi:hypothetical protein